jgi:sugar fermentation stimulation protein A
MDAPYPEDLVEARYLRRPNRFTAFVEVPDAAGTSLPEGEDVRCFLPNPGRLTEFRGKGRPVLVEAADPDADRSTDATILAFRYNDRWVSVDTHLPNQLVRQALDEGALDAFDGYETVDSEVQIGDSRLDHVLRTPEDEPDHIVEVKSVTLVVPDAVLEDPDRDASETVEGFEDGVGLFPDAVTDRGARHVRELAGAREDGYEASVLYCVQRDDSRLVRPHAEVDPTYAEAVREAAEAGVGFHAVEARVTREGVELVGEIPAEV